MTEENWKETNARRDIAAIKKQLDRARRPYVFLRHHIRPSEGREIIQDQVFQQILLETIGEVAQ